MSSKKWLVMFFVSALLIVALIAGLNVAVDPFGVFGDRIYNWYSYDETLNPRAAKIAYLDKHYEEYDSYVIGCSSSSSFPAEDLNAYYSADFYNLIMYGADMLDVEQTVAYIIEHYTVKNIVLSVYIDNGISYNIGEDDITKKLDYRVSGSSAFSFYSMYLFSNPRYAVAKIQDARSDSYLPQTFDVFNEETGAYDKRARDAEPIGDLEAFLGKYPVFTNYPAQAIGLTQTGNCMKSVEAVCRMCADAGINLQVVCNPVYSGYLANFDPAQVEDFYTRLADITPYWDFTMSSVSCEPRYFYDGTHFRNCVGTMALARMFGDEHVYIPDDFGVYVTQDNVQAHLASYWDVVQPDEAAYTADVPILVYHNISGSGDESTNISAEDFEAQIRALSENGYTAVSFDVLMAYVNEGAPLPEKPVVITFDDGYLSNYELAYPILKEYNMKATIFVIGVSVGQTRYKDTNYSIIPHFSYEQAKEMVNSGLISIQSHTYDMHQWPDYETGEARENILMLPGEDENSYIETLQNDFQTSRSEIEAATGLDVDVIAYPYGVYDTLTQAVLMELGVRVTLSTISGSNTVIKGMPQSLLGMQRYTVKATTSVQELLELVGTARG